MRLTKFTHACVRIEHDGRSVVLDPGAFSEAAEALEGAAAVLVTHEHADHVDAAAISAALAADPALHVWAPEPVAAQFPERATAVGPGESFAAAGLEVGTVGGQHAVVHSAVPMCANVGFTLTAGGRTIYHPGDSYAVPTTAVDVLLLPTSGPWLSVAAAVDFAIAVRAERAYPVHDALLSELGTNVTERILRGLVGPYGVAFEHLAVGGTVEV